MFRPRTVLAVVAAQVPEIVGQAVRVFGLADYVHQGLEQAVARVKTFLRPIREALDASFSK